MSGNFPEIKISQRELKRERQKRGTKGILKLRRSF
jgi:hypothetical protein